MLCLSEYFKFAILNDLEAKGVINAIWMLGLWRLSIEVLVERENCIYIFNKNKIYTWTDFKE